jgi:SAM-dependent methyltransferase
MRNRRNLFKIFYGKNYDNLYRGISGFFFKQAHKNLEKLNYINSLSSKKILEVGPGRKSHYDYIENKKNISKYYFYEKEIKNINYIKKKYKKKKPFIYIYDLSKIKNNSLDRIICSHVIEHVIDPEKFILCLFRLLKKGGSLCITLPCDPGFLWSMGRVYNYFTFWRLKEISKKEYYYHMSCEHVNSIQNLINILKYNFLNYSDQFLPFRVRSINLNLMYNIIIYK